MQCPGGADAGRLGVRQLAAAFSIPSRRHPASLP